MFFLGSVLLEVPGDLALHRSGATLVLPRRHNTWGPVALFLVLVTSFLQLAALRVLGLAEAGSRPGNDPCT